MLTYLYVMLGGALGTGARFWLSVIIATRFGEFFPVATLFVNVTGSFAIGFFAALTDPEGRFPATLTSRQFFMIGVCGGYTTFSAFSLQTLDLAHAGEWWKAGAYVTLSLFGCLLAVWLGRICALSFRAT